MQRASSRGSVDRRGMMTFSLSCNVILRYDDGFCEVGVCRKGVFRRWLARTLSLKVCGKSGEIDTITMCLNDTIPNPYDGVDVR